MSWTVKPRPMMCLQLLAQSECRSDLWGGLLERRTPGWDRVVVVWLSIRPGHRAQQIHHVKVAHSHEDQRVEWWD